MQDFLTSHFINQKPQKCEQKPSSQIYTDTIIGRIIFDLRLIFQEELKLRNYKLPTVSKEILSKTLVEISQETLNQIFREYKLFKIADYLFLKVDFSEQILLKMDYWNQATEFSRLYGTTIRNINRG